MRRLLHPWRGGRLWPSLVHTVLDMPIGVAAFIPAVVLSALSLGLAILVPIALVTLTLLLTWAHIVATVERSRTEALLGVRLENPVHRLPAGSPWRKLRAAAKDRARWKEVVYCWLRLPVSGILFVTVVGSWALSLAMTALPTYVAALPRDTAQLGRFGVSPTSTSRRATSAPSRAPTWPWPTTTPSTTATAWGTGWRSASPMGPSRH